MRMFVMFFGGFTLGVAGLYFGIERSKKTHDEDLQKKYSSACKANIERHEALMENIRKRPTEKPPKS